MNGLPLYGSNDLPKDIAPELRDRISKLLIPLSPLETDLESNIHKLEGIRALLFDVYGTLLISGTGDISMATERANLFSVDKLLQNYKIEVFYDDLNASHKDDFKKIIEDEHRIERDKGADYPEVDIITVWHRLINNWLDESYIAGEFDLNKISLIALEYELLVNPVWTMPGLHEVLENCKRKNMKMGIVSNAQFYTAPTMESLMHSHLSQKGFDNTLCSWSYKLKRAKPSKEIFRDPLKALNEAGISPSEVLYIGNDMLNDIYTASEAGCRTALFAGDARSLRLRTDDSRCSNLKPDIILTNLRQLEECI